MRLVGAAAGVQRLPRLAIVPAQRCGRRQQAAERRKSSNQLQVRPQPLIFKFRYTQNLLTAAGRGHIPFEITKQQWLHSSSRALTKPRLTDLPSVQNRNRKRRRRAYSPPRSFQATHLRAVLPESELRCGPPALVRSPPGAGPKTPPRPREEAPRCRVAGTLQRRSGESPLEHSPAGLKSCECVMGAPVPSTPADAACTVIVKRPAPV